jgi:hypothetical protein
LPKSIYFCLTALFLACNDQEQELDVNGLNMSGYLPVQTVGGALVSTGVLEQVELMVIFGIPPFTGWKYFGNNLLTCEVREHSYFPPRETRDKKLSHRSV